MNADQDPRTGAAGGAGQPASTPESGADTPPAAGGEAERARREASFTRRALLRAGWVAPVILTVGLPSKVFAGSGKHTDTPHADGGHIDAPGHFDGSVNANHADAVGHLDGGHFDAVGPGRHQDNAHTDASNHADSPGGRPQPHVDAAHLDFAHNDFPHMDKDPP
jgi:hypothetical protein